MKEFPYQYSCQCLSVASESAIKEVSQFVVTTNYIRHNGALPNSINEEIQDVYCEDLHYQSNSWFYVMKNDTTQNIVGSIRVIRWDKQCVLPIEKKFGVSVKKLVEEQLHTVEQVFHIGRFAVSTKEIGFASIILFKILLTYAFRSVCVAENSIVLAELDKKLCATLQLFNIHTTQVGQSKIELGSETIPICIDAKKLYPFVEKYKHLCYV